MKTVKKDFQIGQVNMIHHEITKNHL